MSDLDVIGRAVPKRDGADKVTGRTRYLHDLAQPRLAHGKILRARHAHARIVRVDTRRAAALPGVLAVLIPWTVIASCSPSFTGMPRSSSFTYPTADTFALSGELGERSPGRKSRLHAGSITRMPAAQL